MAEKRPIVRGEPGQGQMSRLEQEMFGAIYDLERGVAEAALVCGIQTSIEMLREARRSIRWALFVPETDACLEEMARKITDRWRPFMGDLP